MSIKFDNFIKQQLLQWKLATENTEALKQVQTKTFEIDGFKYLAQINPARALSSNAKVDAKSIANRPCFLCTENRPLEQNQINQDSFSILLNPYPILEKHFTIVHNNHCAQSILNNICELMSFTEIMPGFSIFYNGPLAGASAPDHLHFQALPQKKLPIENETSRLSTDLLATIRSASIYTSPQDIRHSLLIKADSCNDVTNAFTKLHSLMSKKEGEKEPSMNIIAWKEEDQYQMIVIPREKHRPSCFFSNSAENMLISPGAVDMAGIIVLTRQQDFNKIQTYNIRNAISEVSLSKADFDDLRKRITNQIKE